MKALLAGIGTAVPPHSVSQEEAADLMLSFLHDGSGRARAVRGLYARSGIGRRHSVVLQKSEGPLEERQEFYTPARDPGDFGPSTSDRMARYEADAHGLAARAAGAALRDAEVAPGDVTHLITVTCTGFFAPGLDTAIIRQVGLTPEVHRTHVGFMGCHGLMNGLRAAGAVAAADPTACVLVSTVELCTLHLSYSWDPQDLVANALFADGAAALVVRSAGTGPFPKTTGTEVVPAATEAAGGRPTPRTDRGPVLVASDSCLLPDSREAMTWRIGDHGFRMTLSPGVPEAVRRHAAPWVRGWLEKKGLGVDEVGSWAVHPGGPRVLTAFADGLELEREAFDVSRDVLARYGNMSSATLGFILQALRDADAPRPWVAAAFGPGLTVEAALLE